MIDTVLFAVLGGRFARCATNVERIVLFVVGGNDRNGQYTLERTTLTGRTERLIDVDIITAPYFQRKEGWCMTAHLR